MTKKKHDGNPENQASLDEMQDETATDNVESIYQIGAEEFEEIKTRISEIEKQRDEYLGTAQRIQADLENYRRRNASLRTEAIQDGKESVIVELLPVIDNFERALQHAREQNQSESFIEGFEMIEKQMKAVLESNHVVEISGYGEPLDPNTQMAIAQEVSSDVESGCVCEVFQKGYRFEDGKVIRHAMVKVAQ